LDPQIRVSDYLPNIYSYKNGNILRILDIFRIILSFFILITGNLNFIKKYRKNNTLFEEEQVSLLTLIFEKSFLVDILSFFFYFVCNIYKWTYLNYDLEKVVGLIELEIENRTIPFQSRFEFYNVLIAFEIEIILECLLIFFFLFKLTNFLVVLKRLNVFIKYIIDSFFKVCQYFVIIMFLIISFSIFSNNLWGCYLDEYRNLSSSMIGTLLFSIGHFNKNAFSINWTIWNIIYILLFFMIFIYFIITSFVGIYMESYRVNSLKYGNSYDYRLLNDSEDAKAEKEKNK